MDEIKTRFITETIEWISKNDYHAMSLRTIVANSGLTTGAFYNRFKNKNDLFEQVAVILSQKMVADLHLDKLENQQPFDVLVYIGQKLCANFAQEPFLMDFLFLNSSLDITEAETDFNFLKLIKQLINEIPDKPVDNETFFLQIWSFIQGYSLLIKNKITKFDKSLIKLTLSEFVKGDK